MDTLAEKLNTKLQEWQPNTVEQVRQLVTDKTRPVVVVSHYDPNPPRA